MSDETAVITEQEFDGDLISPPDRFLAWTFAIRTEPSEDNIQGDHVGQERHRLRLRGQVSVPQMTAFLKLETRINLALGEEGDEAERALEHALESAMNEITGTIAEKNPGFFDYREVDGRRVRYCLEPDVQQTLGLLAWLSGDVTVADRIAKSLTAGVSTSKTPAELAEEATERAERGEGESEAGPLASSEPSPSTSSSSDASTVGAPDGGTSPEAAPTESPGDSSSSTSATPASA